MGVVATFDVSCRIDILTVPRITLGPGKHVITDSRVIRVLRGSGRPGGEYPGCRLISMEPEAPPTFAGGEVAGTHRPAPPEVEVRNYVGLQFKEKRPIGGRVADSD